MSAATQPLTADIPDPDEPGTWLVEPESLTTERTVGQLPAVATDRQCAGPQLFALVDVCDPDRAYYYGIDVGSAAFTVRRDPESHQTNFGSWISMQTAFERLDGLAGGPGRLALVVFDSAPAVAVTAIGALSLAIAPTNELAYQAQWNWHGSTLDPVDHGVSFVVGDEEGDRD
jgi:hypothetical protein